MDNQSQSQEQSPPASTIDHHTRDQHQSPSPTTPSTALSLQAPADTETPASDLGSRVWFVAQCPGTTFADAHQEPVHDGEHVSILHTPFADIAGVMPNDQMSLDFQRPQVHPRGTQYSMVQKLGQSERGTLVGVLEAAGPAWLDGSMIGLPEIGRMNVGSATTLRPLFAPSDTRDHGLSQQTPAETDTTSRNAGTEGSPRDMSERSRGSQQ